MSSLWIREGRFRKKKIGLVFLITAAIVSALLIAFQINADAQEPVPTPAAISDDQVNAIARNMYCPVCENIPLDVCPTQACAEWRELIRDKLMEGWSEEQIGEYFVVRFGDRVSSTPPLRGINWLVYVVPPLVFIAASVFLLKTIRKSMRRGESELNTGSDPDEADAYVRRLEEELKHL